LVAGSKARRAGVKPARGVPARLSSPTGASVVALKIRMYPWALNGALTPT
jgi:hypothetical protein